MSAPLLAAEVPEFVLTTLKILSLIGIAAVGGLLLGWVAAVVAKLYFAQTIPPKAAWFIRTLGFVACGLIAWVILFNAGGSGIGGGGWWPGGGGGPKDGSVSSEDGKKKDDKEAKKETDKDSKAAVCDAISIEVLGGKRLQAAAGKEVDPNKEERRYRVVGEKELLTLPEAQKRIKDRGDALRLVEIVLYGDSPNRELSWVTDLEKWARDLRTKGGKEMKVDVREKG